MKYVLIFSSVIFSISFGAFEAYSGQKDLVNDKNGVVVAGYDVVAYFENAKKNITKGTKGSKDFLSVYDGHQYYFSSEKNKQLFDGAPKNYLPQYGGWCAWAVADGKVNVPVNYNTFLVAKDNSGKEKLYLFYNSWGTNTLTQWKKGDHQSLVNAANKSWKQAGVK